MSVASVRSKSEVRKELFPVTPPPTARGFVRDAVLQGSVQATSNLYVDASGLQHKLPTAFDKIVKRTVAAGNASLALQIDLNQSRKVKTKDGKVRTKKRQKYLPVFNLVVQNQEHKGNFRDNLEAYTFSLNLRSSFVDKLNQIQPESSFSMTHEELYDELLANIHGEDLADPELAKQQVSEIAELMLEHYAGFYNEVQVKYGKQAVQQYERSVRLNIFPFTVRLIADSLGMLQATKQMGNVLSRHLVNEIIDLISAVMLTHSTSLSGGNDVEKVLEGTLFLKDQRYDAGSWSAIAQRLVEAINKKQFRFYKRDLHGKPVLDAEGNKIDIFDQCTDDTNRVLTFFNCMFSYRYLERSQRYHKYLQLKQEAQANYEPRPADWNKPEEIAEAMLDKPKRGRPKADQSPPRFTMPKLPPGKPSKFYLGALENAKNLMEQVKRQREAKQEELERLKRCKVQALDHFRNSTDDYQEETRLNFDFDESNNLTVTASPVLASKQSNKGKVQAALAETSSLESNFFKPLPIPESEGDSLGEVIVDCTGHECNAVDSSLANIFKSSNENTWIHGCKLVVAYDPVNHHPVMIKAFPGTESDDKILGEVIQFLKDLNFSKITIICDRGFQSLKNRELLDGIEVNFVMLVKNSLQEDKQAKIEGGRAILQNYSGTFMLSKHYGPLKQNGVVRASSKSVAKLTQECDVPAWYIKPADDVKLTANSARARKFSYVVALDIPRFDSYCKELLDSVDALVKGLNDFLAKGQQEEVTKLEQSNKKLMKYLTTEGSKNRYVIDTKALADQGFVECAAAFVTNLEPEYAARIVELYRIRWQIELYFRYVKHMFGENQPLHCHSDATCGLRIGVLYTAVSMNLLIANSAKSHGVKPETLLRDLGSCTQKVKVIRSSGKQEIHLQDSVPNICSLFNKVMNIPKIAAKYLQKSSEQSYKLN